MKLPIVPILALLAALPALSQEPYTQLRATGPQSLVIAYRCTPDQRVKLRQSMVHTGVARFESWKTRGILKDYHILFNSYLDSETYDMVALLEFAKYSDVARWNEIEKTFPGGLGDEALGLITAAVTTPIDPIRRASAATHPERGRSVYFIIPYDYLVSTDEYIKYLDGYVIPQVNGWIAEDVLAGYTIGIGRYATSRPWSSLFVLEYRDAEAFGKREATVAKVRERLKTDPAWKALSENKQKVRIEKQTIIAEELLVESRR
jgi:hypothetical protein